MNRHEVERRLRILEAKMQFVMNSLAMTRTNNDTGKKDSRSFDALFNEVIQHEMVAAQTDSVAGDTDDDPKSDPAASGRHASTPGPDGFSGTLTDDGTPKAGTIDGVGRGI